jgi:hypothetical protein
VVVVVVGVENQKILVDQPVYLRLMLVEQVMKELLIDLNVV